MELFGRNKNRRKGKEKTRKEKNVTETYGVGHNQIKANLVLECKWKYAH